jgi:starch phosphorylase
MRQRLTATGEQVAERDPNDPALLPVELACDAASAPVRVEITLPSSTLVLQAYRAQVGRVSLYLLDADIPENRPEDRAITKELYGGDHETRLRQEIALGRGGAKLLAALGIAPGAWHCNEGHAAFLSLERVRALIREQGLTFDEARELCRATTIFTTHTPVPAGHDRFGADLMRRYFSDVGSWLGVPWERFFDLGRTESSDDSFNMTYLAMNFAAVVNGVSALHGDVSRKLLHPFWRDLLPGEVPVAHVTNGVHLPTWTGPELASLLRADARPLVAADFAAAEQLSDEQLWAARGAARRRLLRAMRERITQGFQRRSDRPALLEKIQGGLDENALWIGFARRFAPYKRAQLLFRDRERLAKMLNDPKRPLRIVLSGKAHPRDALGQQVLREVVALTREEPFAGRVFFLEDYDTGSAATLVQGVDVWLNTPTRTLEASGTSGMKAAANGGLNVSILDGWWCEAADGQNGWSIGGAQTYTDPALQDELDATTLYALLEDEVLPCFFDNREQGRPGAWLARVRRALTTIPPHFNTDRMVSEYLRLAYEPLAACGRELASDGARGARSAAEQHARIRRGFRELRVLEAHIGDMRDLAVGDLVEVQLRVDLSELRDDDVVCELVVGHAQSSGELARQTVVPLKPSGGEDTSTRVRSYEGSWQLERCGSFRYGIRIRARRRSLVDQCLEDLAVWA